MNGLHALRLMVFLVTAVCVSCSGMSKKNEARAHYKLGVSYLNGDNVQSAYLEFQKSLDLNSGDKETHNALGIVYLRLEDFQKAEAQFKKAVRLDSSYSEAYNNLCFVYYEMNKLKESISSCQKALENKLYKTPEKAYYNLGRSYYNAKNYLEARE